MTKTLSKLELILTGRENLPKLEARILVEAHAKSCHAAQWVTENDLFDDRLIFGESLLALKDREQEFTGKIKCVYTDLQHNTGSAFTHYDEGPDN